MKTKFKELLETKTLHGFSVASEILSMGEKAERIAKQAKDAQDENGEHAKMFACNIQDWMGQIVEMAQSSLDKQLIKTQE
tara:strand:+ start:220 stop:459 length:240 start_codon:yes stop_codon:yes gene_type:complete